jgi:hypothetical protein
MRRRERASGALFHSLSEFAYIMLFLTLGAAVFLYAESRAARARAAEYAAENERLTEEVQFLTEMLEEKRHGVVPCWRRPEGVIPKVVGRIVIHGEASFTVERTADGRSVRVPRDRARSERGPGAERDDAGAAGAAAGTSGPDEEPGTPMERLDGAMRSLFAEDLRYAGGKNCYLRVAIENETNDYALYDEVASVVTGAGMVVARD